MLYRTEGICMLKHRTKLALILILLSVVLLTGCGNYKLAMPMSGNKFAELKDRYFSTGMAEVLMAEQKYSYENFFDKQVWTKYLQDMTMEEYVKDSVKESVRGLMCLNRIAEELDIILTEDESTRIAKAAEEYCDSDDEHIEDVENIYRMIMLAEKAFYAVTGDVDEEVSTDDARTISVQYIFLSTMEKDESGNIVEVEAAVKNTRRRQIEKLHKEIKDGGDFAAIALRESDATEYVLELGRGQYDKAFEEAAFSIEMGEISGVVETGYGYYIIKCINDNVEGNVEKRKSEIVLQRRREIFEAYYLEHAGNLKVRFNDKYLNGIDIEDIDTGNGKLYEIYKKGAVK